MQIKKHGLLPVLSMIVIELSSCSKDDSWDYKSLSGTWIVEYADPWVSVDASSDILICTHDRVEIFFSDKYPNSNRFKMRVYGEGEMSTHDVWLYECFIREDGFNVSILGWSDVKCQTIELSKKRFEFVSLSDQRHFKLRRLKE